MVCHKPIFCNIYIDKFGKKKVVFPKSDLYHRVYKDNFSLFKRWLSNGKISMLPCGQCIGCRLEQSRQWAVRCMHECKCHTNNIFVTLTYDDEHLSSDLSLQPRHITLFMKRLRKRYPELRIRYFCCGEYGERYKRPHYHICLFNVDFPDKVLKFKKHGFNYYESKILTDLWGNGMCCYGDVTFESAAYVARYVTKKITGDAAAAHYAGRHPEFLRMSTKPGIGKPWFENYFLTDVKNHDSVLVRGRECSIPRYYSKLWERMDPAGFIEVKAKRLQKMSDKVDDYGRLQAKRKCSEARFKRLVRMLEAEL